MSFVGGKSERPFGEVEWPDKMDQNQGVWLWDEKQAGRQEFPIG